MKFSLHFDLFTNQVNYISISKMHLTSKKLFWIEKHEDPSEFMAKADKRGEWMVQLFIKMFAIGVPISIVVNCTGSVFYSLYKYGYVNLDALYHPYRLVYVNNSIQFNKMCFLFNFYFWVDFLGISIHCRAG